MANQRVHAKLGLERWNAAGTQWWDDTVHLVGDVDLEAETVTVLEPDVGEYSERDVQEMEYALYAEAHEHRRQQRIADELRREMLQLAQLAESFSGVVL